MTCLVTLARGWIGTPYVHQAARRGAGCDCLGLLRGVLAEATGERVIPVPAYTPDWSEPQGEELLWKEARARLCEKAMDEQAPGDVLLFRMRHGAVAKHIGLQAEVGRYPTFIHAYQGHGVLESTLSAPWKCRLVARFSVPDIT